MEYLVTVHLIHNRPNEPKVMGSQTRKRYDNRTEALAMFELLKSDLNQRYKELDGDLITEPSRVYIKLSVVENGHPVRASYYVDR